MKKILNDEIKIRKSENINDLGVNFAYPYDKKTLSLLKKENHLKQEYYYIEKGEKFAFFVMYHNCMNIFTFGQASLYYPVKVIGYPCSLSIKGYITNDKEFLLSYLDSIKGAKLILNCESNSNMKNWIVGETLPTCILKLNFESIEDYISRFRSSYRRRINSAIKKCNTVHIKQDENSEKIYSLYLNTYNKSNYKLEKLEKGFFKNFKGTTLTFYNGEKTLGFVLLKGFDKHLDFMLCGMDYTDSTADLYIFMLYNIVKFGIENGYNEIDMGQTSELTKMKFGAELSKRYFYASHSSIFMRTLLKAGKGLLEYKYKFPEFRVFKEMEK